MQRQPQQQQPRNTATKRRRARRRRARRPRAQRPSNPRLPANQDPSRPLRKTAADSKFPKLRTELHGCGLEYAGALCDPAGTNLACVPSPFPNLTETYLVWAYLDCVSPPTLTDDFFVVADPVCAAFNNRSCIVAPGPGYVVPANHKIDLTQSSNLYQAAKSNSTYAAAAAGPTANDVSYRVVGCTLQLRYTGTELNMGGTYSAVTDPNHNCLHANANSDILNKLPAASLPITRDWITLWYRPVLNTDYTLTETFVGNSRTIGLAFDPTLPQFYMGAWITPAVQSSSYQARLAMQVEFCGTSVRGAKPTRSDPDALSATVETSEALRPTHQPLRSTLDDFMTSTEHALGTMHNVYQAGARLYNVGKYLASLVANTPGNDVSYRIANTSFST